VSLSPLLFALLVPGAAALVVLWVLGRRRREAATAAPVCGACGYNTVGLTSLTCPECGSDLRAVGILTPHTAAPAGGFAASAVAFCILWLLCLPPLTTLVSAVVPTQKHYERRVQLSRPSSGLYDSVLLRAQTTGWGDAAPTRPVNVTAELAPPSVNPMPVSPSRLDVNLSSGAFQYTDAAGRLVAKSSRFDREAVLEWLAAAGVDVRNPAVRDEAALIAVTVQRVARVRRPVVGNSGYSSGSGGSGAGGTFASRSETETGVSRGSGYGTMAVLLAWLALGIAGLRYLWVMTRARARAAAATAATA